MADHTFYCEVVYDRADIKHGIYSFISRDSFNFLGHNRLVTLSNKIWRQGPRGGVKIIKDRTGVGQYGYVTGNEAEMKKFMWAKLRARTVN